MSGTIEREAAAASAPRPPMRRARGPRWRAALRMAARQVRRDGRTSVLVAALVALPLAGVSTAAVYYDSHQPTLEQQFPAEVGQTDARLESVSSVICSAGSSSPSASPIE